MRRLLILLGSVMTVLVMVAGPASAHADLASSDPAGGAQLGAVPPLITLTFGEPLQGTTAKVGVLVAANDPIQVDAAVSGSTVTIDTTGEPFAAAIEKGAKGKWAIGYQVVSADGHPIDGTLTFLVNLPDSPQQASPGQSASPADSPQASSESADAKQVNTASDDASAEEKDQVEPWQLFLILAGSALVVFTVVRVDRAIRKKKSADQSE